MPRIAGSSIATHVAQQEAAVLAAAVRLFGERGVSDVTLGDIAAEVGLARNSLYRYFPDKAHILAVWFRSTILALIADSREISERSSSARERLVDWVSLQLEYLTAPEHQAMVSAANELASLPDDVRAEIAEGHRELYATGEAIIAECLSDDGEAGRDCVLVTQMIAGLVRSAAEALRAGTNGDAARSELVCSALRIVS